MIAEKELARAGSKWLIAQRPEVVLSVVFCAITCVAVWWITTHHFQDSRFQTREFREALTELARDHKMVASANRESIDRVCTTFEKDRERAEERQMRLEQQHRDTLRSMFEFKAQGQDKAP